MQSLLPNTKPTKDLVKYFFGGGVAGNFAQGAKGSLKVRGRELRGEVFQQAFPGVLYEQQGFF